VPIITASRSGSASISSEYLKVFGRAPNTAFASSAAFSRFTDQMSHTLRRSKFGSTREDSFSMRR
jgi:hypothetical protein